MNELKHQYVCYFDILGYKDYFKNGGNKTDFLNKIIASLNLIKHIRIVKSMYTRGENRSQFHLATFSDNFIFSMPSLIQAGNMFEQSRGGNETDVLKVADEILRNELSNLLRFLEIIKIIQTNFINEFGLFIRGSIVKGAFFSNENIVYGDALIDAVEIESKTAIYPRIVVDAEILNFLKHFKHQPMYNLLIMDCSDSQGMLNYLTPINQNASARKTDKRLAIHKKIISDRLMSFGNYTGLTKQQEISVRESVMRKYIWISNYHNQICKTDSKFAKHLLNPIYDFDMQFNSPTVEVKHENNEG